MLRKLLLLLVAGVLISLAQQPLSYDQLRDIVRSSISQGLTDKEVSKYLRKQKLNFALTEPLIEEFVGWGIGPKTLNVLRDLKPGTEGLPVPKVNTSSGPVLRQPPRPLRKSSGESSRKPAATPSSTPTGCPISCACRLLAASSTPAVSRWIG